jgi:hypothetical protein
MLMTNYPFISKPSVQTISALRGHCLNTRAYGADSWFVLIQGET